MSRNSRAILEKKLGRKLKPWEEAHHKNHNSNDDRPENLEPLSKREHTIETFKGKNALYKFKKKQNETQNRN
jgi:hypothetical protein